MAIETIEGVLAAISFIVLPLITPTVAGYIWGAVRGAPKERPTAMGVDIGLVAVVLTLLFQVSFERGYLHGVAWALATGPFSLFFWFLLPGVVAAALASVATIGLNFWLLPQRDE